MTDTAESYGRTWDPRYDIPLPKRIRSIRDIVRALRRAALELEAMARAGVVPADDRGGGPDGTVLLTTTDARVARRHGFS